MSYTITSDNIDGQFILDNTTRLQNKIMDYSEYKNRNNILPYNEEKNTVSRRVEQIYSKYKKDNNLYTNNRNGLSNSTIRVSGGNIARSRIENTFIPPAKVYNPISKDYDKICKSLN